ncbi:two-component system, OmpR family, phosphate regulon response regulator PhoB [Desulfonatronum thiosulfatophilum]|uniref:Two-component system, OmpR family, phosphate regulon response regulator PhoB n=1 Tax=Desulfonatronum thiosulfatophilum TaxID=617002 RepID=A0A1G6DJ47_9BACT|nr:response regulator transcription factor [Desulfonatronum thiosulfatophilum]SDB45148.1 two-component system, OmpR family, phosphate regulon response regulator PhoB [Desulfonatronum thiosulfatophilum]
MLTNKVLVIEDEEDIQNLLLLNLESSGYKVFVTDNGFDGLKVAREELPEVILLDLMLPHMDGLEMCRRLKSDPKLKQIKVLMLTAKGEEVDRIVGFELGADDYVVKPFSIRELLLRIKALIRRDKPVENGEGKIWKHEGMEFDFAAMQFRLDGKNMNLTATELKLLAEFIQNQGKVLSRESLLNNVWGYKFEGYNRTVDTHIRRLRIKLGRYAHLIHTSRGLGYTFELQD